MAAANDRSFSASPQPAESSINTSSALPEATGSPADAASPQLEPRITLPPLPQPPKQQTSPREFASEIARLDRALVAVVLALAFLLASIPVRNSDFWMHLATGRLLAQGQYQFGVDPFSYTNTDYWANHAWLYDVILYGLAGAAGGPESEMAGVILVGIKALLVALLAWIMLRTSRPGRSLWIPVLCTSLSLLAMSVRLFLQPIVISMLFLSLTLYILQRPRHVEQDPHRPGQESSSLAVYWWLVPLFVLWVNLDGWFLLGPITVALYLMGQLLQRFLAPVRTGLDAPEPRQLRVLGMVLVAGLAACLLNPHHYHAFRLPSQLLTSSTDALEREDLFRQFFYSLLQEDYWQSRAAWTIATLAYWPLLILGVASFTSTLFTGWRWWRLTIWLAFLLLGVYQVRAIPFFAVVAAPITALNWQDVLATRLGTVPRTDRLWKAGSLAGRLLGWLLGLGLLGGAWSGWLHLSWLNGVPTDWVGRRVAWAIDVDPSLRKTAQQLQTWRDQRLLGPDDHGFNYSPDIVNYCAWFCPQQKGFYDYRFELFSPELAREFVDVRQSLRGIPAPAGDSAPRPVDWQELFRSHHINHVVLYGNDSSPLSAGISNSLQSAIVMLFDPQHWTLLYMDGRTTIFRWNDPASQGGVRRPPLATFDPNPLAFGPQPEQAPALNSEQAPPQRDLAAQWLHRPPVAPLDGDLAARYLGYFSVMRQPQMWAFPALAATEVGNCAGNASLAAASPGAVAVLGTAALRSVPDFLAFTSPRALEFFLRDKSYGPAAAPILAVRAARRAIAASPDYAESYFALAEAYGLLWGEQEEHWVGPTPASNDLVPRQKLREVQLLTALEYYVLLRPDNGEAHRKLFQNYIRLQYWDLALDHLRAAADFYTSKGPSPRESPDEFKRRLDQMQQDLAKLRAEVKSREDNYQVDARDKPLSGKVEKALLNGLIKRARDLLMEADAAQRGPAEMNRLLDLLVSTGRPDEARELLKGLSESWRPNLGSNYEWYNTLIGAACGNYQQARLFLEEYLGRFEQLSLEGALRLTETQTFQGGLSPLSLYGALSAPTRVRQLADWHVLCGMLALEEGANTQAAKHFEAALNLGEPQDFAFESRPIATHYLQLLKVAGSVP